jgi:hypothetical protein
MYEVVTELATTRFLAALFPLKPTLCPLVDMNV